MLTLEPANYTLVGMRAKQPLYTLKNNVYMQNVLLTKEREMRVILLIEQKNGLKL